MRLTKFVKIKEGVYERKELWLERKVFSKNAPWRMALRRLINKK